MSEFSPSESERVIHDGISFVSQAANVSSEKGAACALVLSAFRGEYCTADPDGFNNDLQAVTLVVDKLRRTQ